MNKEITKALARAEREDCHKGIKTQTFVFNIKDMMADGLSSNGQGNEILDQFCEEHNVLSAVFNIVNTKLIYFLVYR